MSIYAPRVSIGSASSDQLSRELIAGRGRALSTPLQQTGRCGANDDATLVLGVHLQLASLRTLRLEAITDLLSQLRPTVEDRFRKPTVQVGSHVA